MMSGSTDAIGDTLIGALTVLLVCALAMAPIVAVALMEGVAGNKGVDEGGRP